MLVRREGTGDGHAVDFAQEDYSTTPEDAESMALSVTRHASTPSIENLRLLCGRECLFLAQSLPTLDLENNN